MSLKLDVAKTCPLSKGIWGLKKYKHTVTTLRAEASLEISILVKANEPTLPRPTQTFSSAGRRSWAFPSRYFSISLRLNRRGEAVYFHPLHFFLARALGNFAS